VRAQRVKRASTLAPNERLDPAGWGLLPAPSHGRGPVGGQGR
jgi:hypothetical protein